MSVERPRLTNLLGMAGLMTGLMLYAFLAAAIGDRMVDWPLAVQMVYYAAAGIIWIWPAKKVLDLLSKKATSRDGNKT